MSPLYLVTGTTCGAASPGNGTLPAAAGVPGSSDPGALARWSFKVCLSIFTGATTRFASDAVSFSELREAVGSPRIRLVSWTKPWSWWMINRAAPWPARVSSKAEIRNPVGSSVGGNQSRNCTAFPAFHPGLFTAYCRRSARSIVSTRPGPGGTLHCAPGPSSPTSSAIGLGARMGGALSVARMEIVQVGDPMDSANTSRWAEWIRAFLGTSTFANLSVPLLSSNTPASTHTLYCAGGPVTRKFTSSSGVSSGMSLTRDVEQSSNG
mmetsp:Transcript_67268/g.179368  ORF Transcript_67268/g.179368 Transcript_67268/m.179368 type:complete len:266 (-) Transcript_67268:1557-2354(-)